MKKSITSLISVLFFCSIVYSQDTIVTPKKNFDFGLTFMGLELNSNRSQPRLKLELRKNIYSDYWLKASVNSSGFVKNLGSESVGVTDSIAEVMSRSISHYTYYAQIGLDRLLGKKQLFFIGTGFFIGYERNQEIYITTGEKWSPITSRWEPYAYDPLPPVTTMSNSSNTYGFINGDKSGHLIQHYIIIGAELNFGINAHLSKRFDLGLQASPQIIYGKQYNQTARDPENLLNGTPNFWRFNGYLDVSIRFRFNATKG